MAPAGVVAASPCEAGSGGAGAGGSLFAEGKKSGTATGRLPERRSAVLVRSVPAAVFPPGLVDVSGPALEPSTGLDSFSEGLVRCATEASTFGWGAGVSVAGHSSQPEAMTPVAKNSQKNEGSFFLGLNGHRIFI